MRAKNGATSFAGARGRDAVYGVPEHCVDSGRVEHPRHLLPKYHAASLREEIVMEEREELAVSTCEELTLSAGEELALRE
eukprot:7498852-Lingulodinium_polyedra.AAC.1